MENVLPTIELVPLREVINDIPKAETALFNACLALGVPVYVKVPPVRILRVRGLGRYQPTPSPGLLGGLEEGSDRAFDIALSDDDELRDDIAYVEVSGSDLSQLKDGGRPDGRVFGSAGLVEASKTLSELWSDRYRRVSYETALVVHYQGGIASPSKIDLITENLRVDRQELPKLRHHVKAIVDNEDPWQHRVQAPAVHLLYRAAKHFVKNEYSAEAAFAWISMNDTGKLFKGKKNALKYAANLINRSSRKSREETEKLNLEILANNKLGIDYREDPAASNRLKLLLVATDYWIHDRNCPDDPFLPREGLQKFLISLGFTSTEETAQTVDGSRKKYSSRPDQCKVAYLEQIIRAGA